MKHHTHTHYQYESNKYEPIQQLYPNKIGITTKVLQTQNCSLGNDKYEIFINFNKFHHVVFENNKLIICNMF